MPKAPKANPEPEKAPPAETSTRAPGIGELAPFFKAAALHANPTFAFDTAGGRHILMLFFGTASHIATADALAAMTANRELFDDEWACFFGVTCDPQDEANGKISQQLPGVRHFLDYDRKVSALYGAISDNQPDQYQPHWLLLDRQLRVIGRYGLADGEMAINALRDAIANVPDDSWAPIIQVPNIFEPEFCSRLIQLYEQHGGEDSGFMREVDGKTVMLRDHSHKRRSDYQVDDAQMIRAIQQRIFHRLRPIIHRAFQFEATRMERYTVACYDAEQGGFFRPHRDNTTPGTAHRRFAVTINLNAEDYEGGDLRFPEFGPRTYRAPTGGAVVFSCSLLHEATPVTGGKRYAFLPFLYDDAGAMIREANNAFLGDNVDKYQQARARPSTDN